MLRVIKRQPSDIIWGVGEAQAFGWCDRRDSNPHTRRSGIFIRATAFAAGRAPAHGRLTVSFVGWTLP